MQDGYHARKHPHAWKDRFVVPPSSLVLPPSFTTSAIYPSPSPRSLATNLRFFLAFGGQESSLVLEPSTTRPFTRPLELDSDSPSSLESEEILSLGSFHLLSFLPFFSLPRLTSLSLFLSPSPSFPSSRRPSPSLPVSLFPSLRRFANPQNHPRRRPQGPSRRPPNRGNRHHWRDRRIHGGGCGRVLGGFQQDEEGS